MEIITIEGLIKKNEKKTNFCAACDYLVPLLGSVLHSTVKHAISTRQGDQCSLLRGLCWGEYA